MRLVTVPLDPPLRPLPARVRSLLDDADERIEAIVQLRRDDPLPAFVPSDFVLAWSWINALVELNLAPGARFMEWGSGAGVITCLASLVGFDAIGVEIESDLIELAEALADEHGIDAEFVCGTFVPEEDDDLLADHRDVNWLQEGGQNAYHWLDLEPDDFDVIFAYPWPGEEAAVTRLFARRAAHGALLMTYNGQEGMRLVRKVR